MYCNKCNTAVTDGSTRCPNCGAVLDTVQTNTSSWSARALEYYNESKFPADAFTGRPLLRDMTNMKWFKFIVYAQLFVSAASGILSGVIVLLSVFGTKFDLFGSSYSFAPEFETLNIVYGVLLIALGLFAILVRFLLVRFKRFAPFMYFFFLGASLALSIIWGGATSLILEVSFFEVFDMTTIISLIVDFILILLNISYFNDRKYLFCC